jgi:TetR/AcrR family transcriptional regulator
VASAVGLGKSSLFHHFRSKAELYLDVLRRVFERIDEHLGPVLAAGGTPFERLDRAVDALIDALAENPTTSRLLLRGLFEDDDLPEDSSPAVTAAEQALARLIERIESVVGEGVADGSFRRVSRGHTLQTLIGAIVYHFASGEFGETLIGRPLFSAEAVRRRKDEVKNLLHRGLTPEPA